MRHFSRPATGLLFLGWILLAGSATAQDSSRFVATGKPLMTIYSNFHSELSGRQQGRTGFALTRVYLGYQYDFHPNFKAAVKLDIGSPDDLHSISGIKRYAYFKNAYLEYHTERFRWSFGLVSTKMFKLSEKYWRHRYIAKPYLDLYRFGPSADLGMVLSYKFLPSLSADFSLLNGEGYTRLQVDSAFKYALGITWKPHKRWVLRGYGDLYRRPFTRSVVSFFTGYRSDLITLGGEADYYFNAGPEEQMDKWGASLSFSWDITGPVQYFLRLDYLNAGMRHEEGKPWDLSAPGTGVITGLQYAPVDHVKMALTWRSRTPSAISVPPVNWLLFNLEVRF
jgi:hypothetical protein